MVTGITLPQVEAMLRTCFEARLQGMLEQYFRTLRERVPAVIEKNGTLPITFWLEAQDSITDALLPIYLIGLQMSAEVVIERPHLFANIQRQLRDVAQHLSHELAQTAVASAARVVSDLRQEHDAKGEYLEALRQQLRMGTLGDARAGRLAVQETGRVMNAGERLVRHTFPSNETLVREKVCIN